MWDLLHRFWPVALGLVEVIAVVAATSHAVLNKRDTRAVIGWVGLVWLAPIIGALLYYWFGVNRIERKAVSLRVRSRWSHRDQPLPGAGRSELRHDWDREHAELAGLSRLVGRLTELPLTAGNLVEPLRNGDECYPAMLAAIAQAERSVSLSSYIFDSDRAGDAFLEALAGAERRGVEVRVLIDAVGSRYSRESMVVRLQAAGVKAAAFLPTRVPRMFKYANLRNHRKLLVLDGRIGFTGGTNIREGHWLQLNPRGPVECLHFRLQGPVVLHLQETFATDWAFACGESLYGPLWFPEPSRSGEVWARGVPSGPDEDLHKMRLTLMGACAAARQSIHIVTPYFLPEAPLIEALNVAALRGVAVQIVLPSENNIALVQWASTALLWQILIRGCRVYVSPPPFDHTKLVLVDGLWALIGSTNWDARSLRLNFEFNVECYDSELAGRLEAMVTQTIAESREVTLDDVDSRSLPVRLRDGLARLFSPYL